MEYTNAPVKGQLKIYKQGEVLKGFDKDFQYEMAGLAGAEFEVYTLHEEFAPHGYLVANDVTFTVKDTGEVQKVEMKDEVPVGELIINKKGEFLDSVTLADKVKGVVEHIFNYVTGKLTDVTFEVYAEEDIKAGAFDVTGIFICHVRKRRDASGRCSDAYDQGEVSSFTH